MTALLESGASAARRRDGARPPRPGPGRAAGRLSPRGAPVRRVARRRLRPQERLGRDRRRRRAPQSSRRVHHLHRVRVHAVARGRQHAPQRGLRRRRTCRKTSSDVSTPPTPRTSGRGWTCSGNAAATCSRSRTTPTAPTAGCSRTCSTTAARSTRTMWTCACATNRWSRSRRSRGRRKRTPSCRPTTTCGGLRDLSLPDRPVGQGRNRGGSYVRDAWLTGLAPSRRAAG